MEQKKRKIPLRHGLGCNAHRPKNELLRVVRDPEGAVSLDFKGRKPGRGAYICRDVACLRKVRKSGRVAHALSCEIPADVWEAMEEELLTYDEDNA